MAERKFDYESIAEIYKKMQNITGNKGDASSIAGILEKMDKDVHDNVDVSDQAIYGDLARQLLLDWENTSSNFNSFVNNFEKWSAVVAKSAGDYQAFEDRVKGLKTDHSLGMTAVDANGKGLTTNYIDSSYYSTYTAENFENQASQLGELKDFNGASYIDTNMIAKEQERVTGAKWAFGLNTASTVLSLIGGSGIVKAEVAAGKVAATWTGAKEVTTNALSHVGGAASNAAKTGSQAFSSVSDKAATKVLGLTDDMLDELAMTGGTPTQLLKETLGSSGVGETASRLGTAATSGSNTTAAKILGLSDDVVEELATQGITPIQYATTLLDESLHTTLGTAASKTGKALGALAGSPSNLVAGAGTAVNVFAGTKENKTTIDGTTYTANPYLSTVLPSDQETNNPEEDMFLYNGE